MSRKTATQVHLSIWTDLDELIDTLCVNLEREEIKKVITELDLHVADYDFTEELAKHFIKELRSSDPDDFDINKLLED
jgi:hypothetical protein